MVFVFVFLLVWLFFNTHPLFFQTLLLIFLFVSLLTFFYALWSFLHSCNTLHWSILLLSVLNFWMLERMSKQRKKRDDEKNSYAKYWNCCHEKLSKVVIYIWCYYYEHSKNKIKMTTNFRKSVALWNSLSSVHQSIRWSKHKVFYRRTRGSMK